MNILNINQLSMSQIQEFTDDFSIPIYKRMHHHSASGNANKVLNWGRLHQKSIDEISLDQINKICHYAEALPSLVNYSFHDKEVMILGSSKPWLEILLLKLGAKNIKTIEYRQIEWQLCDQLSTKWESFTFDDLIENKVARNTFKNINCFVSYSSLEHSGLGRYGDQIDPNGDLNTLSLIKNLISPSADFLIAFPLGSDALLFNRHRVYGKRRLQKICKELGKYNISLIKPRNDVLANNNISNTLFKLKLSQLIELPCGSDGVQGLLRFF